MQLEDVTVLHTHVLGLNLRYRVPYWRRHYVTLTHSLSCNSLSRGFHNTNSTWRVCICCPTLQAPDACSSFYSSTMDTITIS